ncbi:MAG TPA: pyridoxamine 5'-phosphate oxidase family protein [Gemmatimonadaceae bacterium]|nr:pyridoxamine 5'-phosphate oxidase family protein [Gemmatimonadaceae bacterium]
MTQSINRRKMIVGSVMLVGAAVSAKTAQGEALCVPSRDRWPRKDELVGGNDRDLILSTARKMMIKQGHAALVTIDDGALPRVRSVATSDPEVDMTVWILTSLVTRKVAQIRARPEVALHYVDIDNMAETTLMGVAELHADAKTLEAKNFYSSEQTAQYWPGFPNGYVMIAVRPIWLEIAAPHTAIKGDKSRRRPAGLKL